MYITMVHCLICVVCSPIPFLHSLCFHGETKDSDMWHKIDHIFFSSVSCDTPVTMYQIRSVFCHLIFIVFPPMFSILPSIWCVRCCLIERIDVLCSMIVSLCADSSSRELVDLSRSDISRMLSAAAADAVKMSKRRIVEIVAACLKTQTWTKIPQQWWVGEGKTLSPVS